MNYTMPNGRHVTPHQLIEMTAASLNRLLLAVFALGVLVGAAALAGALAAGWVAI